MSRNAFIDQEKKEGETINKTTRVRRRLQKRERVKRERETENE